MVFPWMNLVYSPRLFWKQAFFTQSANASCLCFGLWGHDVGVCKGNGSRVFGERCSFACNLISPHLTPTWVLRKPQCWVARALLTAWVYLETAVALLRREQQSSQATVGTLLLLLATAETATAGNPWAGSRSQRPKGWGLRKLGCDLEAQSDRQWIHSTHFPPAVVAVGTARGEAHTMHLNKCSRGSVRGKGQKSSDTKDPGERQCPVASNSPRRDGRAGDSKDTAFCRGNLGLSFLSFPPKNPCTVSLLKSQAPVFIFAPSAQGLEFKEIQLTFVKSINRKICISSVFYSDLCEWLGEYLDEILKPHCLQGEC